MSDELKESQTSLINALLLAVTMLLCGVFASAWFGLSFNGHCQCGSGCSCRFETRTNDLKPDRERIKPGPTP